MWLRILGLPDGMPSWWCARNVDEDAGVLLDALLRRHLPGYRFSVRGVPLCESRAAAPDGTSPLCILARPSNRSPGGRDTGPEVALVTEDGPDAGRLAALPRSGLTVGRNRAEMRIADPFLSGPHFQVVVDPDGVRVVSLVSRTRRRTHPASGVSGEPRGGAEPWTEGSSSFRLFRGRPDPLPGRAPMPTLAVDPGPEPARPNALLQAVMALGPLVVGVVLAVVTGHWYFLLFSLLSVAVAGVMWAQHRSARKQHARRIVSAVTEVRQRLEAVAPAPGTLALAARSSAADRFGTHGAVNGPPLIRWGTGTTELPLVSPRERTDWSAFSRRLLPVVSELHPGGLTRVTGRRSSLKAMSHWLVVQLCRDAAASSRGVLVRTETGSTWLGGGAAASEGTAIVHPGATNQDAPAGWHRVLLTSQEPAESEGGDGEGTDGDVFCPDRALATVGGLHFTQFRWHGLSARTAEWLLDELGATPRPRMIRPPARMALPVPARPGTAENSLRCPLTGGPEPMMLDLVGHGPHALVAGTTGSGKSELLLTALVGLAAGYPPAEVSFVLMDFKGGSSFVPLSGLPHTMSVETNLVEAESLRTLDALAAELRRREELFLSAGSADYAAFRRASPHKPLPRLVVAIDELRVLIEDHPQSAAVLARLAATGRSLGFHLVLATQRAQGAVSPDIRSNLGTILCLRTATEQESWDLLGCPDAHAIDAGAPGTAFIRHGGASPVPVQAARYTGTPGPAELIPWDGRSAGPEFEEEHADWPDIVRRMRQDVEQRGLRVPEPVVTPSLPERWQPTAATRRDNPGAVIVGLADRPLDRCQEAMTWRPARDAPAAWIGTDAGGLRDAARAVLHQLAGLSADASSVGTPARTVVLDGHEQCLLDGEVPAEPGSVTAAWTVVRPAQGTADRLAAVLDEIRDDLARHRPVCLVVTAWGRWAGLRVGSGYDTVEEHLALLLRDHPPSLLAVAVFGGRELAGGRVLGQMPIRFYVPAGSTPEQRMVWPTLRRVRELPCRAVMVTPEHPAPGLAVQLSSDNPRSSDNPNLLDPHTAQR